MGNRSKSGIRSGELIDENDRADEERITGCFIPCPRCRDVDKRIGNTGPYKTLRAEADGTVVRYQLCKRCGHRFKSVELDRAELDRLRAVEQEFIRFRLIEGERLRMLMGLQSEWTAPTIDEAGKGLVEREFRKAEERRAKVADQPYAEAKGREGASASRGTRLQDPFVLPDEWRAFAKRERPDVDPEYEARKFADYWHAIPGAKGRKADWCATWRNWVRSEHYGKGARAVVQEAEQKYTRRPEGWTLRGEDPQVTQMRRLEAEYLAKRNTTHSDQGEGVPPAGGSSTSSSNQRGLMRGVSAIPPLEAERVSGQGRCTRVPNTATKLRLRERGYRGG